LGEAAIILSERWLPRGVMGKGRNRHPAAESRYAEWALGG